MVEYIDNHQLYNMLLIEENNKSALSPKIKTNILLNTLSIYNYVKRAITNNNINEAYKLEIQFKTILRCIWSTKWNKIEYPDDKYLNNISKFARAYSNVKSNINIPRKNININRDCNHIDQYDFTLLQYCLFPSVTFKDHQLTNETWDKYLFILQNLIMAMNINERKLLKDVKDDKLKNSTNEEERQQINQEYLKDIDEIRSENTFKLINHLNYLYYDPNNDISQSQHNRCNHRMLWRFVLLRWNNIIDNDVDNLQYNYYLDETKYYNEQEYKTIISRLYNNVVNDENKQIDNQINKLNDNNTNINLLKFYIAVNIYNYQFIHQNIHEYLFKYVKLMTNYIIDKQQTITDWENEQIKNIDKSFKTLSIVKSLHDILNNVVSVHLQIYNVKTKPIIEFILSTFPNHLINEFGIRDITTKLISIGEIAKLFNKYSESTYNKVNEQLKTYDIKLIENVFIDKFIKRANNYTPYIIKMITQHDNDFKDILYNYFVDNYKPIHKLSDDTINTIACYAVLTNDERYYNEFIKLFKELNPYIEIDFIISTEQFIPYMSDIKRSQSLDTVNKLMDEIDNNNIKLDGFRRFKIDVIAEKLDN